MAKQSKPKAPKGRAFIDTVLAEAEAIAPAQRDQPEPEPQLVLPGVEPVKTKQQRETEQRKNLVLKVWGRYIERWRLAFPQRLKNEPQLLGERVRLIDKMLKAYRAEALIIAIDAMFDNPWRVENGHYQLEAAIKDGERIDRLLGEAQDPKVKDRQGKVVPIRRPNQITQSLPETSEGYHARIHFTDDGWVDADGKPIETPSVEALSRYGRGSS